MPECPPPMKPDAILPKREGRSLISSSRYILSAFPIFPGWGPSIILPALSSPRKKDNGLRNTFSAARPEDSHKRVSIPALCLCMNCLRGVFSCIGYAKRGQNPSLGGKEKKKKKNLYPEVYTESEIWLCNKMCSSRPICSLTSRLARWSEGRPCTLLKLQ